MLVSASMFGWQALLRLGLFGAISSPTLPHGAERVSLPALPVQPMVSDLDARGTCAIINTDLGFLALTLDEGQTFRAVPTPWEIQNSNSRVYCAGDRFFVTRNSDLFGLVGDAWQRVGAAPSRSESNFRGVVQAAGVLYVGTGTHVFASRDGGSSFTAVLAGIDALASNGTDVFAAKDKDVYQVGASDTLTPLSKLKSAVRVLAFANADLFAATEKQLFRSEDHGSTWKQVPGAPPGIVEMSAYSGSLLVKTSSEVRARDAKGRWSSLDKAYRARPGLSRLWASSSSGYLGHFAKIGDAFSPDSLPNNPMPTVRALAANGKTLAVAFDRPMSLHVSPDSGKTWLSACPNAHIDAAVLDGTRLQLTTSWGSDVKKCGTPGLKTRFVPKLPQETCNGDVCVRFENGALFHTRDRGKSWRDLTVHLDGKGSVVAAVASGREVIVALKQAFPAHLSIQEYSSFLRSTDDGQTFAPFTLPFTVTAFAAGDEGWFFGTHLYGVVRVPYAGAPPSVPSRR